MSDCFLGEIRIFSYSKIPRGWLPCDGTVMQITQNRALFALIGTAFGGNGTTNFNLPNFQGSVAMGAGTNPNSNTAYALGNVGGTLQVVLTASSTPLHNHNVAVETISANNVDPTGGLMTKASPGDDGSGNTVPAPNIYASPNQPIGLNPGVVQVSGGSEAHSNLQPYNTLVFCIATVGNFPSRS